MIWTHIKNEIKLILDILIICMRYASAALAVISTLLLVIVIGLVFVATPLFSLLFLIIGILLYDLELINISLYGLIPGAVPIAIGIIYIVIFCVKNSLDRHYALKMETLDGNPERND